MASAGRYRAAFAVVATLAAGAAGCGNSDDSGPSKADFVKNANAVCARHHSKISAAAATLLAGGKLPSPQQFGRLAQGTIIPEVSKQITELRAVKPSKDEATADRRWLDDSQALKDKLQRNPALIQNPKALAGVNGQADRLGLSSNCHIGPG
jgi:hypothetical protein